MLNPCLDEFTVSKHKFLIAMFAVVLAATTTFALLSPQDTQTTAYVHDLTSSLTFTKRDDQTLTRNYASAKHEVASWLTKVGPTNLYSRLQRMRDGQSFVEAMNE